MKMAVLYYTRTGNTKKMAEFIAEGMRRVEGVETGVFSIDAVDVDFVKESKCVVLGTPTYLASMAAEVKVWLDSGSAQLPLGGKIGGSFATQGYLHGGAHLAIQSILSHLMVKGMLVYSGGGALGKPVIHLGPVAMADQLDASADVSRLYGERMAKMTAELFS